MRLLIQLLVCISMAGWLMYKSIDHLNDLTELQLSIPIIMREVKEIREKNLELQYKIDQFESPIHLLELSQKPEFGHLKFSSIDDVIFLPEKQPSNLN
ncbi:MAG: hypothetical protein Q8K60_08205 [Parachlamydiaceae bacterium]|nr:hypothetical protein [Parachlamydiaceae bacterium]